MRAGALLLTSLLLAAPVAAESPAVNYLLQCQGCHGADGRGSPGSVPALAGLVARYPTLPGGRAYLARVPGAATSPISDVELAELLTWIVRRFGPEEALANFAPYTEAEVAAVRRPPLVDVDAVREPLLAQLGVDPAY